jgi:hypothetical protein
MNKILFFAAAILASQMTFAATPDQVINDFEQSRNVTCEYTGSSSMKFCFNTMCTHTEYYNCGGTRLVLKVRSVQYPDGSQDETVTSSSVGGF